MREGTGQLGRYAFRRTVPAQTRVWAEAARIVGVDVILGQLTVELPDGRREMRFGRDSMFLPRIPHVGDWYVEDEGERAVVPKAAFEAAYSPLDGIGGAGKPSTAPHRPANPQCSHKLRQLGLAYARTCQVCGLGPCREPTAGFDVAT